MSGLLVVLVRNRPKSVLGLARVEKVDGKPQEIMLQAGVDYIVKTPPPLPKSQRSLDRQAKRENKKNWLRFNRKLWTGKIKSDPHAILGTRYYLEDPLWKSLVRQMKGVGLIAESTFWRDCHLADLMREIEKE